MQSTEEQTEAGLSESADAAAAPESQESQEEASTFEELLAEHSVSTPKEGELVTGTVIEVTGNDVLVDVGLKSEGIIPIDEFRDVGGEEGVEVGDQVEVLLERLENAEGKVQLSRHRAERMKVWNRLEEAYEQSLVIQGTVVDRIKGGLTVDVGVRAFLPGSLVDIRPIKRLESLKGEELEFKVINLDRRRNNVVLSRKAVLEKEYEKQKSETIQKLEPGVVMPGVVKNLTDYGAFVDLGGIDGLLHITDMSWGRINHPSEMFEVGDEVEVVILNFDPESERVSLGYKQRGEDPWETVDKKYPLGSRVRGTVVSLVEYGAFVELEEGVEGLIHVSEMSWTKKVVNPAKVVDEGEEVEAIVSELDMEKRRISLSLRQAERNPWEDLLTTHPVGSIVEGKVRNLTEFGAFVEITPEIDGLVHVSDMSWTKRVTHPNEVVSKGDTVRARITHVDVENQRVSLSIKEFLPNEWDNFLEEHKVGDTVTGRVVNVAEFGLFVDVFNGLEGLVHVSEVDFPGGELEDHFATDDWVRARVLRIEEEEKKIGLAMRGVDQPTADEILELEAATAEAEEAVEDEAASGDDATTGDAAEAGEEEAVEAAETSGADEESAEAETEAETEEGEPEAVEASAAEAEEPDADGGEAEAAAEVEPAATPDAEEQEEALDAQEDAEEAEAEDAATAEREAEAEPEAEAETGEEQDEEKSEG